MTDFTEQDLSGSTFRRVRLADALLQDVDLSQDRGCARPTSTAYG